MSKIDNITTVMMEYICDTLCRYPTTAADQDQLDDICAECEMGKFVCDILNNCQKPDRTLKYADQESASQANQEVFMPAT